ncbi:MAG: site-2 protease family protein [Gemmatimonadetes bacterium]|nr:site-2 protease family protein [Gemmatimonadota bacterium]
MDWYLKLALVGPVLLFSMVAHEYAHGYAAYRQGDPTAWQLGRLTWNPARHIDPFLTVILPLVLALLGGPIFGGAKPVPVNPRNYRNYKRGDIIVSLAGVATNFVIAIACVPLILALGAVGRAVPALQSPLAILQVMFDYGILLNLSLVAFNLLPIPPLDGSHVFKYLLPPAWALRYQQVAGAGFLILLLLLSVASPLLSRWMAPATALWQWSQRWYLSSILPLSLGA